MKSTEHHANRTSSRWLRPVTSVLAVLLLSGVGVNVVVAQEGQETSALEVPQVPEVPALESAGPSYPELERAIEQVLADPELQRAKVGIHVEDAASGEVLYSHDADAPLNPASNIKLITAATALDLLGPHYTFSTELATNRRSESSIGDLYVIGSGEAFLLFKDVLAWAGELKLQGIDTISGDLIIDESAFEEGYLPPGYETRDTDASYRSSIGALSVNFNTVTTTVTPATPGEPAQVRLDPPQEHVEVVNRTRTVAGGLSRVQVSARPSEEGTIIEVGGTIGQRANPVSVRKRVDNPPEFAGAVMARALKMVGIGFDGEVRPGAAPQTRERLHVHHSAPLIDTISAMNKWSNNFMAEQLLLATARQSDGPATWEEAIAKATDFMVRAGFDAERFSLHNGSGLYEGNEVSARQFVSLLRYMRGHAFGPEFIASLPIAGIDGSLRNRLREPHVSGNLRAKTGTLNNVTALSGYVQTRSGRQAAFSILINDPPRRAWVYRPHQDRIAQAIANFDE
ncbi:D-alanyl-D-alanine carboxypeptidase/D-alanyl-D-alanine-endopeptidase [Lujinxingia litoralis]|uniref:D-alanyl-D-alanine carboxypeptidase/D-alanyl-D-alanine-endopeptidase n=1 Tax=Lujinxingia litoralis TaxID=2211119 RepID=A0A328CBL4_9DELT|nr:D-alanyl-D-alanine carboxypeptidase/D-alanyl-D-alanine-endopeptidase [Lujinxingia litoralis]RAL24960.1 D-alanyl-D-alanine carboxypeptidase/D-alanyl-D-alanine-endopeptidase [Lujinxingia litoralis]